MASSDTNTNNSASEAIPTTAHVEVMDAQAVTALAHEIADVAAAMFGLLLLQSPNGTIHQDLPHSVPSEPPEFQAEARRSAPLSFPAVADHSVAGPSVPEGGPTPLATPAPPSPQSVPVPSFSAPTLAAVAASAPAPPAAIAVPAGAVPVAIPVPVLVGEMAAEDTLSADTSGEEQRPTDETPSAPVPIAAVAPVAPRTMAMLNEIAFLDD